MKILFICLWNSERSVIAEELYNKYTKSNNAKSVWMRTTKSSRNKHMYKLLEKKWININQKSKIQYKKKHFENADKIYVLCNKKYCSKYLIKSEKVVFWDIKDPWWRKKWFLEKIEHKISKKIEWII